jgi:hypothetical protein
LKPHRLTAAASRRQNLNHADQRAIKVRAHAHIAKAYIQPLALVFPTTLRREGCRPESN